MSLRRYPLLAAGVLLAAFAGATGACAADMPAPATAPWTGFYLGAQVGYLDASGSDTDLCDWAEGIGSYCFGAEEVAHYDDNSIAGGSIGGYLGFNYRLDAIVLGLEGDLNWAGAQSDNSLGDGWGYDMSLDWDASVRARLGYVVGERALLYVTGGPSWLAAQLDARQLCNTTSSLDINCGDSRTEFGWQLGAGAEFLLTDRLSLKAEYLHGWYGDANLDLSSDTVDGISEKYYLKQNLQTNVIRAGLAYHFPGF